MNYAMKLTSIGALAFSLLAFDADAKTIEKTFNVGTGGLLKLETNVGSISVDTHNSDVVEVEVEIRGDDEDNLKVNMSSSGNDVTIIGERDRDNSGFWGRSHTKVAYHITVPVSYNVDVDTAGGSIKINDLIGTVNAHTSGGSIKLGRIDGEVDVNTSGGSIKVDEVTGTINAHTSGGSIKATISKQPKGDSKLTTSGGSITAYLASDIAVDLSARTSGGRVRSEFPINGEINKKSIYGTINGGGPKLVLKTSGGSVKVKEL